MAHAAQRRPAGFRSPAQICAWRREGLLAEITGNPAEAARPAGAGLIDSQSVKIRERAGVGG
jgi:hypothetical protein